MQQTARQDGVSVHAIAGTHAVLLAMNATAAARHGLKGFAIGVRRDSGRVDWLRGFKFFQSLIPEPEPGQRHSTLEHPIQSFLWGHYSAEPDRGYRYVVRPLYGEPGQLRGGSDVEVVVRTEPTDHGTHAVFFNRGAIPSQAFADRFGNQAPPAPDDPTSEEVRWLSRGLLEGALAFIAQANGSRFSLRIAAYEFSYPPILQALATAAASGADVRIVYEAGQEKIKGVLRDTSTTKLNRTAIGNAGLDGRPHLTLIPRRNRKKIPHNKFMVLLENGQPIQVWTGSTNFTVSGFLGQSNVGHLVRDEGVARAYAQYWSQLSGDPALADLRAWDDQHSPEPPATLSDGVTLVFSPRARSRMLDWYGERIDGAAETVMLTAAFGVTRRLAERFDNDRDYLRFILMEKRNRSADTQAMLERDRDTQIAFGARLNRDALELGLDGYHLDNWFREEEHFRKKGHIFYVHTKILMIDLLTDQPLVFSGSANFSPDSLLSNDENMLLIAGNTAVADIYTTEFTRLFNHFYFRDIAQKLAREGHNEPARAVFLDPTDGWVARYFQPGTLHCRRRELFGAPAS